MTSYLSTGQVARLLDTTESRLAELIRRRRLTTEPELLAGRRLWTAPAIREAARLLDLDLPTEIERGEGESR